MELVVAGKHTDILAILKVIRTYGASQAFL